MKARAYVVSGLAFALPFVACAAITWAGCSSTPDAAPPDPAPRPVVDPGFTYGAEVAVRVVGNGRVYGSYPEVSCPGTCFGRWVFANAAATAGATDVKLTATAAAGWRFVGWSFDASQLGARARGPDTCSPLLRAGAQPSIDLASEAIALAFGEVQGTPPKGREAECATHLAVPPAYAVTATFALDAIADAGPDGDAGHDWYFEAPLGGAVGKDIGVYGNRVYWRLDQAGVSHVGTGVAGGVASEVIGSQSSGPVSVFHVGPLVAWQSTNGTIGILDATNGATTATQFVPGDVCKALTSTTTNLYCRTSSTIVSWDVTGNNRTVLYTSLPSTGTELAADATRLFYSDETGGAGSILIHSVPRIGGDGGAPVSTIAVNGLESAPTRLVANPTLLFWVYRGANDVGRAMFANKFGSFPQTIGVMRTGLRFVATDIQTDFGGFQGVVGTAGVLSTIFQSSSSTQFPVRSDLPSLGGIAADSQFVYWTQDDGRVYRISRSTF